MLIKETTPPRCRQFTITLAEDEVFMLAAILGAQLAHADIKLYGYEDLRRIVGSERRYKLEAEKNVWSLSRT